MTKVMKVEGRLHVVCQCDKCKAQPAPVQKRPQNCGTGYCSCIECVMEPAPVQEPVAHRDGYWCVDLTCKKCYSADFRFKHTTPPEALVQDSTCNETLRAQGKAYPRTCRKCGLGPCIGAPKQPHAQPAPVQEPVAECVWEHQDSDYIPDTWESGCGVLWTFTDGSPAENDMKYCCGCGAKLKENT